MKTLFKHFVIKVLEWEAKILLKRHKPKVIAVSGSVGKTSTKDAIYTALTPFTTVRKSDKSFNSEFGIPLTILGLPNGWSNPFKWIDILAKGLLCALMLKEYPKYLVLEVGSDRPGDIDKVIRWLPVTVAVLTRFPDTPVHVEFFKDGHAVNEEDKKICKALSKNGTIVMNADDEAMKDVPERFKRHTISYGVAQDATVRARDIKITYSVASNADEISLPTGMQCTVAMPGRELPLSISGSLGHHHVYPLLAALAVVDALKFDVAMAIPVLVSHESPKGRMRILRGINGSIIIDDTYNSSPVAVEEALKAVSLIQTPGKKIALLGDMLELGIYTEREHLRIGALASGILDTLISVGLRAEDFVNGAIRAGMDQTKTLKYADHVTALNYMKKHVHKGDVVLLKGSQGMRLEKIIPFIMAEPEKATDVLVRQDKEWEYR